MTIPGTLPAALAYLPSWWQETADPAAFDALLAGWVQGPFDFGAGPQTTNGVDALLMRLDPSGALLGAQTYGDPKLQIGQSLALGADGAISFAGRFRGTIFADANQITSDGQSNLFVAHNGRDGALAWTRAVGSAANVKFASPNQPRSFRYWLACLDRSMGA